MDRQSFPWYEAHSYQAYSASAGEAAQFRPQAFTSTEDGLVDSEMAYIDPILHSFESFEHAGPAYWESPTVHRYLNEHQKSAFFDARLPLHDSHQGVAVSRPAPVRYRPLPAPSHARLGSPISSQDPSTISNNALSPQGDPPLDGLPASPESEPWMSPFSSSSKLGPWATSRFPPVSPSYPDAFVNPADVNFSQEPPAPVDYLDDDDDGLDINLHSGQHDFSLDTYLVRGELEAAERVLGPVQHPPRRMSSPDDDDQPPVKDSIEARAYVGDYRTPTPTPTGQDEDADGYPEHESVQGMPMKRERVDEDDDSDDEYKPRKRQQDKTSSPSVRRRLKTKPPMQATNASPAEDMGRKQSRVPASSTVRVSRAVTTNNNNNSNNKAMPLVPTGPNGAFACRYCPQNHFKDEMSLENHVKKQHLRPFACVFHFAGCESTFASKNEWKRHVASQHLMLHYWLCTEGNCGKPATPILRAGRATAVPRKAGHSALSTKTSTTNPGGVGGGGGGGAVFNRKDLYTQHLRRMHMPPHIRKHLKHQKKSSSSTATTPEWDGIVARLQGESVRERCRLPTHMTCPVPHCQVEFDGDEAWDHRMEHVAKHLEQAAVDKEPPVAFGGPSDPTLLQWAARADVAVIKQAGPGTWAQNNPLKMRPVSLHQPDHDLDAEGEDDEL